MFVVTRAISSTGGYPLEGYAPEIAVPKGAQLIDGPVEARKAAREQLDHGADWIKVYMTHRSWVDEQGALVSQPTLTVEELRAIVDEAHGWRRRVACHAYNGIGLQRALDGGCDSIEHGLELTDAQIAQMVQAGHLVRADAGGLLLRPRSARHPGRQARSQARRRPRGFVPQGAARRASRSPSAPMSAGSSGPIPIAQEFAREVEFGMTRCRRSSQPPRAARNCSVGAARSGWLPPAPTRI